MAEASNLISIWWTARSTSEDEFIRWHDQTYLPNVAKLAYVNTGRRYRIDDTQGKFLSWFESAKDGSALGAELRDIPKQLPGNNQQGDVNGVQFERFDFKLARDVGQTPGTVTPWLYIVHTDIPDHIVGEYNEWYDKEHLPRLVTVPGVQRARRYVAERATPKYLTAYDLTIRNAFESPEGLQARKTPWTEKMRALFQNTRRSMCSLALDQSTLSGPS